MYNLDAWSFITSFGFSLQSQLFLILVVLSYFIERVSEIQVLGPYLQRLIWLVWVSAWALGFWKLLKGHLRWFKSVAVVESHWFKGVLFEVCSRVYSLAAPLQVSCLQVFNKGWQSLYLSTREKHSRVCYKLRMGPK